jgi:hypothetical protein
MAKYKNSSISFKKSPKHSTLFRAFGNKENGDISMSSAWIAFTNHFALEQTNYRSIKYVNNTNPS